MRNENGKIELTPTLLVMTITAALAAGGGGASYLGRGGATGVAQDRAVTESNLMDVRVSVLEERGRVSAEMLGEIRQTLREISASVVAIEKKVDRYPAPSRN